MSNAKEEAGLNQAARLFSVLAEPARLRILQLLRDGSMCGRDLARGLNLTPATTCHHIEKLKLANLLLEQRSGRHVYYSVSDVGLENAVGQSLAALAMDESPGRAKSGKSGARQEMKRQDKSKRQR